MLPLLSLLRLLWCMYLFQVIRGLSNVIASLVVFAADTWLHLTTESVNFTQVGPVSSRADYTLALAPNCAIGNNSYYFEDLNYAGCAIYPTATFKILVNASQSLQMVNNVSDSMVVITYENSTVPTTYLGIPPSYVLSQRDYTADPCFKVTQHLYSNT